MSIDQSFSPQSRVSIPGSLQTIADLISAYEDADREAFVGLSRTLTYRELEREIDAAAAAFASLGLKPGDRIAATGASDCDLGVAFLASLRGGFVWVGMNRALAGPEKLFQIEDCGAKLALLDLDSLASIEGQLPAGVRTALLDGSGPGDWPQLVASRLGAPRPPVAIDPFAPAAIAYTSGTTGKAKGVVHTQHSMLTVSAASYQLVGKGHWQRGIRRGISVPLTVFNAMLYGPLAAISGGGTHVFFDRFDLPSIAPIIEAKGIELLGTSATTVYDLIHRAGFRGRALKGLKYVFAGGNYVAEDLKIAFRELYGSELIEDYGLTEAPTSLVAGRPDERAPPGSVGRALPHLQVRALSDDGRVLPAGETGEIAARSVDSGPWHNVFTAMLGYWNRPEETAQSLKGGWLMTGDLGYLDAEDRVFIVGRKKEVIVRGGANIYPPEIERILRADERIEDAVVMGLPDARLGEIAAAYLQLRVDLDQAPAIKADLIKRCSEQLAKYKIPERWLLVDAIPRNQMRKPIKHELRDAPNVQL